MKPHLKKWRGLWYCACEHAIAKGFNPQHAYSEWFSRLAGVAIDEMA